MENENHEQNEQAVTKETKPSPLYTVTPLSKYLAMGLFIVLPFIGGWIGYTYAPEKVVEVEKVVIKEVESKNLEGYVDSVTEESPSYTITNSAALPSWKTYRSEKHNFELSFPDSFEVYENNYDGFSTIISFNSVEPEMSIVVLPKGGADYGLEGAAFTSKEIQVGETLEKISIAREEGFYREFLYFSSSTVPNSWNHQNRIEVRISSPNELSDEILSTFKFIK